LSSASPQFFAETSQAASRSSQCEALRCSEPGHFGCYPRFGPRSNRNSGAGHASRLPRTLPFATTGTRTSASPCPKPRQWRRPKPRSRRPSPTNSTFANVSIARSYPPAWCRLRQPLHCGEHRRFDPGNDVSTMSFNAESIADVGASRKASPMWAKPRAKRAAIGPLGERGHGAEGISI
jgi:hypothetical protein